MISGPAVAKLCARTRKWANQHMHRGSFGKITEGRNDVLYVDLTAVERYAGQKFTAAQLVDAREGFADRVINITEETEC